MKLRSRIRQTTYGIIRCSNNYEIMVKYSDRLARGNYWGSVLIPFPNKQWFRHTCLRSCMNCALFTAIGVSIGIIPALDRFVNLFYLFFWYLGAIFFMILLRYAAIFRSIMRIDFFQEEIRLCFKVLLFDTFYMIRMKRKNVVSELKDPSLLTLKDVFDPIGRSRPFVISGKAGWDVASLAFINAHVKNNGTNPNDPSLSYLTGSYCGTIEAKSPNNKVFLYTSIPRFVLAFSVSYLFLHSTEWLWVVLMTVLLLTLYDELFVMIKRIDVCDGEIVFLGKDKVKGTSKGYIVDVQKIKVQDTHDLFHCRMLKIKEEGSFFPICLSKRHGWSDEKLDELKEVIASLQS